MQQILRIELVIEEEEQQVEDIASVTAVITVAVVADIAILRRILDIVLAHSKSAAATDILKLLAITAIAIYPVTIDQAATQRY